MDIYKTYNDLCHSVVKKKVELKTIEEVKGFDSVEAKLIRFDIQDILISIENIFEDPLFILK